MCGFAGVVVWDERHRVSPETLARMGAAVAHRGPDGAGQHLSRQYEPISPQTPQVGMAFRRLAILDPDPRSMQPFTDGRRWLVFNGEIYNFRDLRAELSGRNQWRTTGDTEVLLAAYAAWGERCVERLNGMFAFAVWDEVDRTLCLATDRMGQKPFYFAAVDDEGRPWQGLPAVIADGIPIDPIDDEPIERRGTVNRRLQGRRPAALAFASEPAALLAIPWVDRSIHLPAVSEYLRWGYTYGVETVFRGCQRLPAAARLTVGPGGFASGPYFDPNAADVTADCSPASVRERVVRAVVSQQVSDVPIGCFLSGGVDSSVIVAALRSTGAEVHTFTVGFGDRRYDERPFARAVANHLGTVHRDFVVEPDAAADLPRLAAAFGEPFADSSALPTHYLSRETRQFVKVALSGDGGDELFGGYDRYRAMRLTQRFSALFELATDVGLRDASRRFDRLGRKGLAARLGRLLATFDADPGRQYAAIMRLFGEPTIAALFPHRQGWPDGHDMVSRRFGMSRSPDRSDVVRAAMALDSVTYLPGDLLTKVDRASMLHGLEVRSPFMDPDVVTFAAGLTADQLLEGGPKRMLREAFAADLPAWVFRRKKMGFAVPVGDWFRGPLRAMLRDTLFSAHAFGRSHFDMAVVQRLVDEHESGRVDHGQRLYALLMLELWWDTVR